MVNRIIHGYVKQSYNTETGQLSQEFVVTDLGTYENEDGELIEKLPFSFPFLDLQMIQPN